MLQLQSRQCGPLARLSSFPPPLNACERQARRPDTPARLSRPVPDGAAWNVAQVFSVLLRRGHAVRRRGREMRAPILDQPAIGVTDGHVEKVDRYHGNDRPIWAVDI